jgi:hypothetical protein
MFALQTHLPVRVIKSLPVSPKGESFGHHFKERFLSKKKSLKKKPPERMTSLIVHYKH